VYVAPFPDPLASDPTAAIDDALRGLDHLLLTQTAPSETAAMILEPVLGEGGYIPAPQEFLDGVVERCRTHGILFIADEVQSGFGRTGKMFAVDHYGIEPDIICMAKGIASGFPFSALGTRRELDDQWPKGSHGGTYGGNPIGCAAALSTIEVMSAPGFLDNVVARGEQLSDALRELQTEHPDLLQIRGPGLMVASSFSDPTRVPAIIGHCLREGRVILMSAGTYGRDIRWMPPLVVTADEIDEAVQAFTSALKATA
jgi:4-aminobutyrate aminotransferase-like enzyme